MSARKAKDNFPINAFTLVTERVFEDFAHTLPLLEFWFVDGSSNYFHQYFEGDHYIIKESDLLQAKYKDIPRFKDVPKGIKIKKKDFFERFLAKAQLAAKEVAKQQQLASSSSSSSTASVAALQPIVVVPEVVQQPIADSLGAPT